MHSSFSTRLARFNCWIVILLAILSRTASAQSIPNSPSFDPLGSSARSESWLISPALSPFPDNFAPVRAAAAPSPDETLRLEIRTGPDSVRVLLHGTAPHGIYQIFTSTNLSVGRWQLRNQFPGTNSPDAVESVFPLPQGHPLFITAGDSHDGDGDGLSDSYERWVSLTDPNNPDTGGSGIGDGYADADGDGWTLLDEAREGTDPLAWDPPPPPDGLRLDQYAHGLRARLRWQPAKAGVRAFELERAGGGPDAPGTVTLPPRESTFDDTNLVRGYLDPTYRIRAVYDQGLSQWSPPVSPEAGFDGRVSRGPGGFLYLAARLDGDVVALRFSRTAFPTSLPKPGDFRHGEGARDEFLPIALEDESFELPASALATGEFLRLPAAQIPWFGTYLLCAEAMRRDGETGRLQCLGIHEVIPFLDAGEAIRQNMQFRLRAATPFEPFRYRVYRSFDSSDYDEFGPGQGVMESGLWWRRGPFETVLDECGPFEENYFYQNFIPELTGTAPAIHTLTSGVSYDEFERVVAFTNGAIRTVFPTANLVDEGRRLELTHALYSFDSGLIFAGKVTSPGDFSWMGIFADTDRHALTLGAEVRNYHGLPCDRLDLTRLPESRLEGAELLPGRSVNYSGGSAVLFAENRASDLQTIGYYFTQPATGVLPGDPSFAVGQPSPLLIAVVGEAIVLAGWAQQRIVKGDPNQFVYAGQYFNEAWLRPNDDLTAERPTGILSEYGHFLPTEPGEVRIQTRPDPTQENHSGAALVHVLKVQLDVNHDGIMDLDFRGPDNTRPGQPYVFWLNNDLDEPHAVEFGEIEEDDVRRVDLSPGRFRRQDFDFTLATELSGGEVGPRLRAIPCLRDLEDYARLWLPGLGKLSSQLPADAVIELGWRATDASNPSIDLFAAADGSGGISYLTNETIATWQIDPVRAPFLGRILPGKPLRFRIPARGGPPLNEHFIFCGSGRGNGELVLRISNAAGSALAEASAQIEIRDIKELYERWTVGDVGAESPWPQARLARDGLPPGTSAFSYPPSPPGRPTVPYILHVHGWNMETWEKEADAETMYKRLYWQGYQGRFGLFRWPTYAGFPAASGEGLSLTHYNESEWQAWHSARALRALLESLSEIYPGELRLTAHSLGTVVASEALRGEEGEPTLVRIFAAMQGVVPSLAYDFNVPLRPIPAELDDDTPDIYSHHCTGTDSAYFASCPRARTHINFYNPVDWALAWWEFEQNLKPREELAYSYGTHDTHLFYQYRGKPGHRVLTCPEDSFELFSFCVEARCHPLGAQAGLGGVFDPETEVLLDPTFAFGDTRRGHSAQFRSTQMKRNAFWKTLVARLQALP